jgi:hypothetical protein
MADDQTDPNWIESPRDRGTGVIALPVHVIAGGKADYRIVYAPDVTYAQCTQLAWNALAFQWVPNRVMVFPDVVNANCGGECTIRCPPGCWCRNNICVKQPPEDA